MHFVQIFPSIENSNQRVYSVVYDGEELHEIHKLRNLWTDPCYLADFYDENKYHFADPYWAGISAEKFALDVKQSVPRIFNELKEHYYSETIDQTFEPLGNSSDVKKFNNLVNVKWKKGYIDGRVAFRIYAIKLEAGCYVITGGAIKIVHRMQDATNTDQEIAKFNLVNTELHRGGVFDHTSFADFLLELEENA